MDSQLAQSRPSNNSIKDTDEDVLIAVQALGNMRHRAAHKSPSHHMATPAAITSTTASTPALSPSISTDTLPLGYDRNASYPLASRVSELPFVNSAIRAYENGKASSRVVKFGAEIVESSVMSMTEPVLTHLGDFAARRFGRLSARLNSDASAPSTSSPLQHMSQDPPVKASSSGEGDPPERQLNNTRWQSVLLEAGGISFAVSSESMRRLKYCLQWLQYATARIDDQILALQNLIRAQSSHASTSDSGSATSSRMMQINRIRGDLVMTIRQVVEIISNYAGSALPEPARARVRDFILSLPHRWANAHGDAGNGPPPTDESRNGIAESSAREEMKGRRRPRGSFRQNSASSIEKRVPPTLANEQQASEQSNTNASARRILTLATESLDMLHNVTTIFSQNLERAEAWVERLRVVGLEPPETETRPEEEESEATFGAQHRAESSSSISSPFPETPATRLSRPPSQANSGEETTDSEEDPERPPRKTMKKDPGQTTR